MATSVYANQGSFLADAHYGCSIFQKRTEKFFQSSDGIDKLFKLLIAIFGISAEFAKQCDAADSTVEGIYNAQQLAKTARDATSFFNIFNGVISALVAQLYTFYILMAGLWTGENVQLKEPSTRTGPLYNDTAETTSEKFLAAGANFGKSVACAAFIGGFGICRPIANIEKHITPNLGETAHNIGSQFPAVMMANHIGGAIGTLCDMGYQSAAFEREVGKGLLTPAQVADQYKSFAKKMFENIVTFLEKSLELMHDVIQLFFSVKVLEFCLPLSFAIGLLSVYKVWLKTE